MTREIITIDEDLCNGCGECIPNCPEGALQLIDGKARLVGDKLCDGLGACIGDCPTGALRVETREAESYDETEALENMIRYGQETVIAHLHHLVDHNEHEYLNIAIDYIRDHEFDGKSEVLREWEKISQPVCSNHDSNRQSFSGCPGSAAQSFGHKRNNEIPHGHRNEETGTPQFASSELSHWPVQMHLINPSSPHFSRSDFVLAADCTAFSFGAFHSRFLKDKTIGIACPKLDQGQQVYIEKIRALIDDGGINTITVVIMQVPCCGGLLQIARQAATMATRKIPIKRVVVGVRGEILEEEWL